MSAKALNWGGIEWVGEGLNEVGKRIDNGETVVRVDKKYFRPAEVDSLIGNPEKAYAKLGWKPMTKLDDLVKEMIEHDDTLIKRLIS